MLSPHHRARTVALLAACLAAVALVAAASVGAMHSSARLPTRVLHTLKNKEDFTDPTGDEQMSPDGKNAPDMSGGTVTNDDKGNLVFEMNIANRLLGPEHGDIYGVFIVSSAATGCTDNALFTLLYSGGGTLELDRCVNGTLTVMSPPASFTASWDGRKRAVVTKINLNDLFPGTVMPATAYTMNLVFWTFYTPDDFVTVYIDRSPDTTGHYWLYHIKFARKKITAVFPKPNFTAGGTTTWRSFVIRTSAPGATVSISGAGGSEQGKTNGSGTYASRRLARKFKKGSHFSVAISKKGYYSCTVGARVLTNVPWLSLSHGSTCGSVKIS